MSLLLDSLPRLFCKPSPDHLSSDILFSKFSSDLEEYISFRSLDMDKDMDLIYDWVNKPYAHEFWKMNGSKETLIDTYTSILASPHAHSFIGLLGNTPVCQIDIYRVLADELSNHVSVNPEDCGMHLLMAPADHPVKELTIKVVATFLRFYFSFPVAHNLFAEPDTNNLKAKKVLERSNFKHLKTAKLSYKKASIYKLPRHSFLPAFI